jgi:NaMN:DMB phosphoribosyltransferase
MEKLMSLTQLISKIQPLDEKAMRFAEKRQNTLTKPQL